MRVLSYEEIQKEPEAAVFVAVPPEGEGSEGYLRIKMPDADQWGDEYLGWNFKVYDHEDRVALANMLLNPEKAIEDMKEYYSNVPSAADPSTGPISTHSVDKSRQAGVPEGMAPMRVIRDPRRPLAGNFF